MIDDLDLPFYDNSDEVHERRRHRRSRHAVPTSRKKKKKKKKRGRTGLALFLAFVLLACLGGGVFLAYDKIAEKFSTPDYSGEGTGEVTVVIKPGDLGADMAETLQAADVIKSEKAFVIAWEANADAKAIQPGTYKLRKQMSAAAAILLLLDPKSRTIINGITIPEGKTSFEIFKLLSEKLKLPEEDFKKAAQDPIKLGVPEWWFTRLDGKPEQKPRSIEGFLFPSTYEFDPNVTAEGALKKMVQTFLDVTTKMDFVNRVKNERKLVSPYEVLIVASLAQHEALHAADYGKVARVAYNRVIRGSPLLTCKCLQFDVTVIYWLMLNGKPRKTSAQLTESELKDKRNPYNRDVVGLVPTPISNPGKAALEGAMAPPDADWIFFVAVDDKGTTKFSSTKAEFCQHKLEAVKNGILTDDDC